MGEQKRPYNNFQQKGFQNIHGNYNQAKDDKPQQRPNLWDHTAKLEEALPKDKEKPFQHQKQQK